MPGHPGRYYLFHENLDYHDVLVLAVNPCYYTFIDMNENNGFGKVLEKNVAIFDYPDRTFGTMTAVKHANGRDWWVVFPEKSKNRFYRFRFSPNGVEDTLVQDLLPVYPNILSNAFITFSPNGSKLARYEVTHGLYLYDLTAAPVFSRTTLLSFPFLAPRSAVGSPSPPTGASFTSSRPPLSCRPTPGPPTSPLRPTR